MKAVITKAHGDYKVGEKIDHVDGMTVEEAEHQLATRLIEEAKKRMAAAPKAEPPAAEPPAPTAPAPSPTPTVPTDFENVP